VVSVEGSQVTQVTPGKDYSNLGILGLKHSTPIKYNCYFGVGIYREVNYIHFLVDWS
jgi:hypothetical protein